MMIGNVSDAYNDYKIYPYALGNDRAEKDSAVSSSEECQTCKNGTVVYASVSIHTSVCPECGKTYVSGGTTNTAIRYPNEDNPYQKNRKAADATILPEANFDVAV